jgi:peptide/histidine transporter 3/4
VGMAYTTRIIQWFANALTKIKRESFILSKGGVITLVWSLVLSTTFIVWGLSYNINTFKDECSFAMDHDNDKSSIFLTAQMASFFLLSCLILVITYIGEKYLRYRLLMFSSLALSICAIITFILYFTVIATFSCALSIISFLLLGPFICTIFSYMFFINIVQFGVDQLQFSPTSKVRNYIHWLMFWNRLCGIFVYSFIAIYSITQTILALILLSFIAIPLLTVILTVTSLVVVCCFKKYLTIESPKFINPFKLIWKIVKYAYKHKRPVMRSAFTYGEPPPSRLDMAKERYGGPFTTNEVEDVKCCWNVLLLLACTFGYNNFEFFNTNIDVPIKNFTLQHYIHSNSTVSIVPMGTVTTYVTAIYIAGFSTTCICILVYQFILLPFLSRYIPSMVKLIGIGLGIFILKNTLLTLTVYFMKNHQNDNNTLICSPINIGEQDKNRFLLPTLIISEVLDGICYFLIYITGINFILAQGPRNMQSFMIGVWLTWINLLATLNLFLICDRQIYYLSETVKAIVCLIIYVIVAYRYTYRQRNERSDVNERQIIEEYTERHLLNREVELESLNKSYSIQSIT